ncbi:MAG TPA: rifamycin-inactivating phosphotransferase [Solirubrobacteraceae bacterium]|nr:rifamycin-inactivating phosphotransferase [Solirubrobacteraceae bacterium]
MGSYVLGFDEIDQRHVAAVGGKAAHLAELSRIGNGVSVPPGFCVTTDAFRRIIGQAPSIDERLGRLAALAPDDRSAIGALSADIRRRLEAIVVPDDLAATITAALSDLGEPAAFAIRSSATAEDLPTASFAGQQDTYLNVLGPVAVLESVSRCWASLFTERAVTYRLRNGFDPRTVHMAVIVQQMVVPQVAGILFTADPVTSNRTVACVEASFGLGESLVSGLVNADVYTVHNGEVVAKSIGTKRLAVTASPGGGTQQQAVEPQRQALPALTDAQIVRLVQLGRHIEAHFAHPQDIEWCLVDGRFQIVQSRPITTVFPIPEAGDQDNHVYVSVGHQQMMTDPFKPLGISLWQLTTPRPMYEAGGRLFVDISRELASPTLGRRHLESLGRSDPLLGDALNTILDRGFIPKLAHDDAPAATPTPLSMPAPASLKADPAIVAELIQRNQDSIAAAHREIQTRSGPALIDFILADIQELRRILFDPQSIEVIMAGMAAAWWLNENLQAWLGEKNAVDTLTQSVPHNVTSEMGLALLDVADVIRPHPDVVAFLQHVETETFLDELPAVSGGREARDAIRTYLDTYGMRCVGEIDVTRPRWSERPRLLVPMILSNIRNFAPGAGRRRFQQGLAEAAAKERELLTRVRALPDGAGKAEEVKRRIDQVRTFAGYREYPKYGMVSRYFVYKQALLREAERLVQARVLRAGDDIFYLTLPELHDLARTNHVDDALIRRRRDAFRSYQALTPPRVFTSDGEVITGTYRRDDLPAGALPGLAVSAGTVEGRARVILDVGQADLEAGDILVTAYTDPSWTPLFVAITGLVTEVGGLMTHGAVIAREYGLPAVVGVEHATRLIRDGQRIRVHGSDGYVEILS